MSTHRVISNQRHLVSLVVLLVFGIFLPVGIRYATHYYPSSESELRLQIEFILPFIIHLDQGEWSVTWLVSAIGILIPIFLFAHLLLIYQVLRISRGEKELSNIIHYLVAVLFISLVGFFPTFQLGRGNIPLPFMIPVGLVFAKFLAAPVIESPFDE
ncbi:MAG: hypothetical protein ACFFF4_18270 [Candidatus Thorarchaeota archaeon]